MNFWIDSRSISRLIARRTAGSDNVGCLVLALERSPSTSVHGSVVLRMMNSTLPDGVNVELALAAGLHALEDLVLHLHVPGIVVFAGLQHGARRGHRVAAALDLERVEMRLVLDVIVGIAFGPDQVARLELDEFVGTGADRLQIARRVARLRADIVAEMMLRQDRADRADEGVGPERRRGLEESP